MSECPTAPGLVPGAVVSSAASNAGVPVMPALRRIALRGGDVVARLGEGGRWTLFVVLSLALHASLLLPGPRGTARSTWDAPFGANSVEVRLVTWADADTAPAPASVASEWQPLKPLPVQRLQQRRMLDFVPVDPPRAEFDESAYLPISRVTLRPIPATRIAVPYPAGVTAGESTEAKIVLFIDDDGSVAKVALAKDQAMTPFARSALSTFERVRYHPAQVDGKPVKVRVVVAVTFEDRQAKP